MAVSNPSGGSSAPSLFIVELDRDGQTTYLVCEQIMSIEGGGDVMGISATHIHEYLVKNQVLAAAIPGGGGVSTAKAGRQGSISVGVSGGTNTINLNAGPPAPPRP